MEAFLLLQRARVQRLAKLVLTNRATISRLHGGGDGINAAASPPLALAQPASPPEMPSVQFCEL